jgi:hypothetical protein
MFFILLIGISALTGSIFASKDILREANKWYERVTTSGWLFILCNLAIIALSIGQHLYNKNENESNLKNAKLDQDRRDSLIITQYNLSLLEMKEKYDSSNTSTVSIITETLGKYGYKLDMANKRLSVADPILQVCGENGMEIVEKANKMKALKLRLCSKDAGSGGFSLYVSTVLEDKYGRLFYQGQDKLIENFKISKGGSIEAGYELGGYENISFIYMLIKGSYWNTDRSKTFPIEELYFYNTKEKIFGFKSGEDRKKIISFIMNSDPKEMIILKN